VLREGEGVEPRRHASPDNFNRIYSLIKTYVRSHSQRIARAVYRAVDRARPPIRARSARTRDRDRFRAYRGKR